MRGIMFLPLKVFFSFFFLLKIPFQLNTILCAQPLQHHMRLVNNSYAPSSNSCIIYKRAAPPWALTCMYMECDEEGDGDGFRTNLTD